jgi:hypothetical protein
MTRPQRKTGGSVFRGIGNLACLGLLDVAADDGSCRWILRARLLLLLRDDLRLLLGDDLSLLLGIGNLGCLGVVAADDGSCRRLLRARLLLRLLRVDLSLLLGDDLNLLLLA